MSAVVWTASAISDLRRIRAYIERFNPGAAANVAASLRVAGSDLSRLPQRGQVIRGAPPDTRELITDYRYITRYRVMGDEVPDARHSHKNISEDA